MTSTLQINQGKGSHDAVPLGWVRRGRVPCLDGIRAIAILLVILDHSRVTIQSAMLRRGSELFSGHFGVTCFFVISGFLISLLLFREFERKQSISIGGFYARRALRLVPAYAAYLLAICIITGITGHPIAWRYWCAALTYTMCYMPHLRAGWDLAHAWTLAVEEHFYLLWPLLIFWIRPKRAGIVAGIYVVLTPAIRWLGWRQHQLWLDIDYASITEMGSIATGCVLAYLVFNYQHDLARKLRGRRAVALVVLSAMALIASILCGQRSGKYAILFGDPAASVLVCACVLGIWCAPSGWVHHWLNTRPMVAIGILSYSIYLWQEPLAQPTPANWIGRWPQNVLFIFAAATASYFLVERPFLRIKARFSSPKQRPAVAAAAATTELRATAA